MELENTFSILPEKDEEIEKVQTKSNNQKFLKREPKSTETIIKKAKKMHLSDKVKIARIVVDKKREIGNAKLGTTTTRQGQ